MKKFKKILYVLFVFATIFLIGIRNIKAIEKAGEIIISKTATKLDETYGKEAKIDLEINANAFTNVDKTDVVLVIDRSTSMNGDKIKDTVLASKDLINSIITDKTKDKVRVGIVSYNKNVYETYTSKELTNNKETLFDLVDNTNTQKGTNIHAGLLRAETLLSNSDANKIIILLTDGEPYNYIGSDLKTVCDKNSKDNNCQSTPTEAPINLSTNLKRKNISIYTVGFQIENNNGAKKVLTDISNDPDTKYSFLANDYFSLKSTFENMVKNFAIIATNGKVIDIIPTGFILDTESLPNNVTSKINQDNTTTLTWNIGVINSLEDSKLSYTITAKENYYGSMYTNISAVFTATSVDNHPIYGSSKPISIDFTKPLVSIPSVTVDDDYTIDSIYHIKQGDVLTVDKNNGVLSNDKLEYKKLDKNAIITDKIVLVSDDDTNGNLDDISMNELTGEFSYKSNPKSLGIVTYKYYIETTILLGNDETIVKSNISTIKLNIIKSPTTYTVHYYELGTTNKVLDDKIVKNVNVYDEISEDAINVDGYNKTELTNKKLVLNSKDNVITFYYTKRNNLSYTINYLEKDTNKVLKPSRIMNNLTYKDKINTSTLIIDVVGYNFDSVDKDTLEIGTKENEINIYYVKGNGTVKILYIDTNNKNIVDPIITKEKIDTEYKIKPLELTKYKLLKVEGKEEGKYINGEILVKYIYERVPDTQVLKQSVSKIVPISSLLLFTLLIVLRKKV